MVTTNQNLIIDTQKIKRKEANHNIKESQKAREKSERKKGSEKNKSNQETFNKIMVSTCISIIMLMPMA